MTEQTEKNSIVEKAVAEGGAYEIICQRLSEQGSLLNELTSELNTARRQEFGNTEMEVLGRMRLRTENNCQAQDLVIVGDYVLFGYNVYIGLKKETKLTDVLSLYQLKESEGQYELHSVALEDSFLSDSRFHTDFQELYAYYKDTSLSQLVLKDGRLLASFQTGRKLTDIRVFRWEVSSDGKRIDYIDNRGERDIRLPASHDFEWTQCQRDDVIDGRNPHINILDTLFVDTLRGDITIKIENNTNVGKGIYSESVEESNQSIDDAEFYYADLEQLVLLKIKPYQEEKYRYLIFNRMTETVVRIDAIGDACVQLPEGHGIIFPGGYYLTSGEYKSFDDELEGLVYKRTMRSPNGEDVLYLFYQPETNVVAFYPYNIIEKTLQNPLFGHGFGFYEDGRMILFYADEEPARVHPIQIWQTPYFSDLYASSQPASQSFYGKIGNADLVRGISELYDISKNISTNDVSAKHYHQLSQSCEKIFDSYFWLDSTELSDTSKLIKKIAQTAESVIDEYEKVESIRNQSSKALTESKATQREIIRLIEPDSWHTPQEFVDALSRIRKHRGHLLTIKEYRYIDIAEIETLDQEIQKEEELLNQKTVEFLASESALKSYYKELERVESESSQCKTNLDLKQYLEALSSMSQGMDLISEVMTMLKVEDATLQTRIVDEVSELYARLNQQRAKLEHQKKNMGKSEATAQFSARLKLLNQSIHNALGLSATPDKCDEQVSRLLVQLDELEGEFSDYDDFISDIINKREEIFETFEEHKQSLIEARQRKAQSLDDAGSRILQSIEKRVKRFSEQDELNTFFAADPLINKVREIIVHLKELDDSVKSEDLDARLKAIKEQSLRALRDKSDLYEDDGQVIKLGPRHKFSVNRQELDLTILPRDEALTIRLSGTDYTETVNDKRLLQYKDYWNMLLPSESTSIYRSEYLAYNIINAAQGNQDGLSWRQLIDAVADSRLLNRLVVDYAAPRYREGYEKGIHDHDAALILKKLVPVYELAGVFKFSPLARGFATVYWANRQQGNIQELWQLRAKTSAKMSEVFFDSSAKKLLADEIRQDMSEFVIENKMEIKEHVIVSASEYLSEELSQDIISFSTSKYARRLCEDFKVYLESKVVWRDYQRSLDDIKGQIGKRWSIAEKWIRAYINSQNKNEYISFVGEAIGILNSEQRISRTDREVDIQLKIEGLIGEHSRLKGQALIVQLDEFLRANQYHAREVVPAFENYLSVRQLFISEQRETLRISEFKAKPLASFVRNRLINEVYLSLIGDNLAKQIGTAGAKKRTDLMGLLLMISPPGYGKTTLMEYVADRLGLIFMKINCPVIGHSVTSVDPQQADNSASKQELEKLNLALEMGNNVMLYLDDIQHTNSEFLQKFISLCDGTRRIEGIWKGRTKTYDMRGKKFCVVMAGNPYTETGEVFQIPDMLANRADVYNLGDVLGGKEAIFDLSYLENSLTSNQVLAPLATRDLQDFYKFIEMSEGKTVATTEFSHQYSGAEIKEIVAILQKLKVIQHTVSSVNKQYIASSAQDDRYRTEPAFKLQGSYRNMNKMSEKVSAIMTDEELNRLVDDHYQGESQLLTNGAEANLLKLAEMRGCLSEKKQRRWQEIKKDFTRNKAMGGDEADTGRQIVGQLNDLVSTLGSWRDSRQLVADEKESVKSAVNDQKNSLPLIVEAIENLADKWGQQNNNLQNNEEPGELSKQLMVQIKEVFETTFYPLIRLMDGKLDLDLGTHQKIQDINEKLELISRQTKLVEPGRQKKSSHQPKQDPES